MLLFVYVCACRRVCVRACVCFLRNDRQDRSALSLLHVHINLTVVCNSCSLYCQKVNIFSPCTIICPEYTCVFDISSLLETHSMRRNKVTFLKYLFYFSIFTTVGFLFSNWKTDDVEGNTPLKRSHHHIEVRDYHNNHSVRYV